MSHRGQSHLKTITRARPVSLKPPIQHLLCIGALKGAFFGAFFWAFFCASTTLEQILSCGYFEQLSRVGTWDELDERCGQEAIKVLAGACQWISRESEPSTSNLSSEEKGATVEKISKQNWSNSGSSKMCGMGKFRIGVQNVLYWFSETTNREIFHKVWTIDEKRSRSILWESLSSVFFWQWKCVQALFFSF